MTELDDAMRRLAERGAVRGAETVFDDATANPSRPGIRTARTLAVAAALVIAVAVTAGVIVRDDAPRRVTADEPPAIDGVFPTATGTVLVFDDGDAGVVAVDVDHRRVARVPLEGQTTGDQPFRLHRTGDRFVVGWGEVFSAPLDGGRSMLVGASTIFVPALEDGTVWLVDYPGGRIGNGIPTLRHVDVTGAVLAESPGLQDDDALPIREVYGGMAYETPDGVVVWDPATEQITYRFDAGTVIGDVEGSLVAWCAGAPGPCGNVHVTNLATGADVQASPTDPRFAVNITGVRFSPDGTALAVQTAFEILLVDTTTGERRVAVTDGLPDAGYLAWADDGRRLFFTSYSYGTGQIDLGVYDLDTGETTRRHLPFGGTLDFVALPASVGSALLDTAATSFEPCAWEDFTCGTTGSTTTSTTGSTTDSTTG